MKKINWNMKFILAGATIAVPAFMLVACGGKDLGSVVHAKPAAHIKTADTLAGHADAARQHVTTFSSNQPGLTGTSEANALAAKTASALSSRAKMGADVSADSATASTRGLVLKTLALDASNVAEYHVSDRRDDGAWLAHVKMKDDTKYQCSIAYSHLVWRVFDCQKEQSDGSWGSID
jgi:hypothetical protein